LNHSKPNGATKTRNSTFSKREISKYSLYEVA